MFVAPPTIIRNPFSGGYLLGSWEVFANTGEGTSGTTSILKDKIWNDGLLTWSDPNSFRSYFNPYETEFDTQWDNLHDDWQYSPLVNDVGANFTASPTSLYAGTNLSLHPMLVPQVNLTFNNTYAGEATIDDAVDYLSNNPTSVQYQYTWEFILFDEDDFEIEFGSQLVRSQLLYPYGTTPVNQNYWRIRIERQTGAAETDGTRAKVSFVNTPSNASAATILPSWVSSSAETKALFSKRGKYMRPVYFTWFVEQYVPPIIDGVSWDGEQLFFNNYWAIHSTFDVAGHANIIEGTDTTTTYNGSTRDIYTNDAQWWGAEAILPWCSTDNMLVSSGQSTPDDTKYKTNLKGFNIIPDGGNTGSIQLSPYLILGMYPTRVPALTTPFYFGQHT